MLNLSDSQDKTAFDRIIGRYRSASFSERDKGDRFERLMQACLKTKPEYRNTLSEVWQWGEFGGKDTGIDIVCRNR